MFVFRNRRHAHCFDRTLGYSRNVPPSYEPRNVGCAGTFNIQSDSRPPNREAPCVDINNGIATGNTLPQIPPDYPAEVLFILDNAFWQPNSIGTPLAGLKNEAAIAVQVVVGNEAFERSATWQPNKKGWRVKRN